MKITHFLALGGILAAAGLFAALLPSVPAGAQRSGKRQTAPIASVEAPVVLELFTSQGCSSCPPADRLAARLAADPSLVVISRPVTYWDRLGWKDTFARQANSELQRGYARNGNEGAGVYTPQIVVDGRHAAIGSRERNVKALIREAAMKPRVRLTSKRLTDGSVRVVVTGRLPGAAQMKLLALSASEAVRIGSGENGGRTVRYTNVVLDEFVLGSISDRHRQVVIAAPRLNIDTADRYAIVLQKASAGPIFAGKLL